MNSRRIVQAAIGFAAALGLTGLMHAPFARSILGRAGGCPFAGRLTPADAEVARHMALAEMHGTGNAPSRPAMGFILNGTTVAEARDWAAKKAVSCDEPRAGLLRCEHVPGEALGLRPGAAPAELSLQFDPDGRLVNAVTFRSHLSAEVAAQTAAAIVTSLSDSLGPAKRGVGSFDAGHLSRPSASSIATVSYRYEDYVADVTAMRLPSTEGGVSVREQYMSARD
ncbi:MAG: hypothetical protein ABSC94_26275 [Polyangiaceae bacterium]|jgi:hypothetical protein